MRRGHFDPAMDEPADPPDEDAATFELENADIPPWAPRRGRRERLLRSGLVTLLVVVIAFMLLGGPAATASLVTRLHRQSLASPATPPTGPLLRVRPWATLPVPSLVTSESTLHVSPSGDGAVAAYTCWADDIPSANTLHIALLPQHSSHWRALASPMPRASECRATADTLDGSGLLLAITPLAPPQSLNTSRCEAPILYLSADHGASWRPIPWPHIGDACNLSLALAGQRIYAWQNTPLLATSQALASGIGRMITTNDFGHSWQIGDNGLSESTSFDIIGVRPGGKLLAQTIVKQQLDQTVLWQSLNAGASWQSFGPLPGSLAQAMVSDDPNETAHGGWGRLYMIGETETNGVPDGLDHTFLATAYLGQGWLPLSLPPLTPDERDSANKNIVMALGVGPADTLLLIRALNASELALNPAQTMWVWNPLHSRWLLDPHLIPQNASLEGRIWSRGALTIWLKVIRQGVPPSVQIQTFTVAPHDLQ